MVTTKMVDMIFAFAGNNVSVPMSISRLRICKSVGRYGKSIITTHILKAPATKANSIKRVRVKTS